MQIDPTVAAKQIVRDSPPHIALALETLEAAGFRVVGNPHELGGYILIECRLPLALRDVMTSDNPHYQQIIVYQSDLARRCLKRVGVDANVCPFGWRLVIWLSISKKPVRKGRPRKDEKASEILKLKGQGYSWEKITQMMNKKLPTDQRFQEGVTKEGIRSLARSQRRM